MSMTLDPATIASMMRGPAFQAPDVSSALAPLPPAPANAPTQAPPTPQQPMPGIQAPMADSSGHVALGNPAASPQPGLLKRMLMDMAYGFGQSMKKSAGLPTDREIAQKNFENQMALQTAQQQARQAGLEAQKTQAEIANLDQVDAPPEVKKALGMDDDATLMLPRNQMQQIISRAMAAKGTEEKQRMIEQGKAAALGYQVNDDGTYTVLDDSKISAPVKAAMDFKNASVIKAKAYADYMTDPQNPVRQMQWMQAQRQFAIAQQRLSLGYSSLNQRTLNENRNYNMNAYGTDASGNPLPGAMTDQQGNVVGKFGQKAVMPTSASQSQAERATVGDATRGRLQTMLKDPDIRDNMGPFVGNIRDYIAGKTNYLPPKLAAFADELNSYAAFKAGLHPVRGLGALEYFDKQIGKLGQTPEQLEAKLKADAMISKSVQKAGGRPVYKGPVSTPGRKNDPLGIR